jgi:hypothetical protein
VTTEVTEFPVMIRHDILRLDWPIVSFDYRGDSVDVWAVERDNADANLILYLPKRFNGRCAPSIQTKVAIDDAGARAQAGRAPRRSVVGQFDRT